MKWHGGKGSDRRPTDYDKFSKNYDRLKCNCGGDWERKNKRVECTRCGAVREEFR